MKSVLGMKLWVKILLFYVIFMLMYFLYKYFPVFPLSLICAINESNFQHYKAIFFAFLFVDLIEYFKYRKRIEKPGEFWFPRLTAAIFAPWVVFLLWYIAPAVYGRMPNIPLEIVYANIITLIVGYFVVILERGFMQMTYSRSLKIIILALFLISLGLYLLFTFNLPWADVFVEPDWR